MTTQLATLNDIAGTPTLQFERRLAHPPEKVWKAITNPDDLAHWFPAKIETEWRVGAPMRFIMEEPGIDETTTGEVVEFEAPKLLAFSWDGDILRFELTPDGSGCLLHFSHTISGGGTWGDRKYAAQHAAGWDQCLSLLDARLAGRVLELGPDAWFAPFETYVEEFGLAAGDVRPTGDGYEIRFERIVIQSPEEVWAALTGGGTVAEGMVPPAEVTVDDVPAGVLTEIDPGHALEYAWLRDGQPAGSVRFEVSGRKYACHLVLRQHIPAADAGSIASLLATWQVHLEVLVAALSGIRRSWPNDRVETLSKWYADHAAVGRT